MPFMIMESITVLPNFVTGLWIVYLTTAWRWENHRPLAGELFLRYARHYFAIVSDRKSPGAHRSAYADFKWIFYMGTCIGRHMLTLSEYFTWGLVLAGATLPTECIMADTQSHYTACQSILQSTADTQPKLYWMFLTSWLGYMQEDLKLREQPFDILQMGGVGWDFINKNKFSPIMSWKK